jgi:hypothetical protein
MKLMMQCLFIGLLSVPLWAQSELRFELEEGRQKHYFVQSPTHGLHLLLRAPDRLVVAFPAANSGVAMFWKGSELTLSKPLQAPVTKHGQQVRLELQCNTASLALDGFLLDSIRVIRDQTTEGWTGVAKDRARRGGSASFREELVSLPEPGRLVVKRSSFSQGDYRLELQLSDGAQWHQQAGKWTARGSQPLRLAVVLETPFQALPPFADGQLLKPGVEKAAESLGPAEKQRFDSALRGLRFLSSRQKFMAGSWRFLTYFGRDTAMSALILRPILQPKAFDTAYQSLLERLSPNGEVAHEESLGCWQVGDAPVYDYAMVDDDFMLPLLSEFAASAGPKGRLQKNFHFVLDSCAAYASSRRAQDLVAIHKGSDVGDWRDSREGMGWGRYSFSVNAVLAPAALESINRQSKHQSRRQPETAAIAWRDSCRHFQVQLGPGQVRARLSKFLQTLPVAEREFYLSRPVGSGGPSLQAFLEGKPAPALDNGLSFHALSLDAQAKPVQVMHSDDSFLMFLGRPTRFQVEQTLRLLELEFPVGLMTGVGPVVANPAYSLDERHARQLGRGAYHGTVIWGWQSALMIAGLLRQRELHSTLAPRIDRALVRLWECERKARTLANSELWTFAVDSGDWQAQAFGQGTASTDESNPVQLWSCVYPAIVSRWKQSGLSFPTTH